MIVFATEHLLEVHGEGMVSGKLIRNSERDLKEALILEMSARTHVFLGLLKRAVPPTDLISYLGRAGGSLGFDIAPPAHPRRLAHGRPLCNAHLCF